MPVPLPRRAVRAALLSALLACSALPAVAADEEEGAAFGYVAGTGDAWLDRQLADVNLYAERYPEAFVDEVVRYGGARRGYVEALMQRHGWLPGDVWFACFWGQAIGASCREPVQARSRHPGDGWRQVVEQLAVAPDNLHWRAVRQALVASYDHWDRPLRLDALLQRQLGDRAQRDAAARERD
nr:hypothetical protein [Stenotrophomonas mori]